MYRLVVVDDETAIRHGICKYINWSELGFIVVADFEDGKETIQYVKENPVDVILTDIEMAEVSGLELAQFIYENKRMVKVVIISGYKEFEYARKAVEYDVEHYLLKPIKMNEIQSVFEKIKIELDENTDQDGEKIFEELLPDLQEQFFISLLVGGIRSRAILSKKKELLHFDFNLDTPCALIDVKLKIDEENNLKYYLRQDNKVNLINNIFQEQDKIKYYPTYLSSDVLKIIAVTYELIELDEFQSKLQIYLEENSKSVMSLLKLKMVTAIESIFKNIMELTESNYSLYSYTENTGSNICFIPEDHERLMQKYKLLIDIIGEGNFGELDQLVENIFFELRKLPLEQVKQLLIDMFSMLSNKFMKMGGSLWMDMNKKINYHEIMEMDNKIILKAMCKNHLAELSTMVDQRRNEMSKSVIEKAVSYMKNHYGEDISLEKVADRYFLNATYFSRLFKQYTGQTFTDFLIEVRMEKAKQLIELGKYKIYEVSNMVGYQSDKYFYRIFKQYTKCSPLQYYRSSSGRVE